MFPPPRRILAMPISVGTDPVFELIEAHRKAQAAHIAAIEHLNRIERIRGRGARADWITYRPCQDENEAFEAMVKAAAVTLPGLLAKLSHLQDIANSAEWRWVFEEREGAAVRLMESFAASIANLMTIKMEARINMGSPLQCLNSRNWRGNIKLRTTLEPAATGEPSCSMAARKKAHG